MAGNAASMPATAALVSLVVQARVTGCQAASDRAGGIKSPQRINLLRYSALLAKHRTDSGASKAQRGQAGIKAERRLSPASRAMGRHQE